MPTSGKKPPMGTPVAWAAAGRASAQIANENVMPHRARLFIAPFPFSTFSVGDGTGGVNKKRAAEARRERMRRRG